MYLEIARSGARTVWTRPGGCGCGKGKAAMFDDDGDRVESARRLAEEGDGRAVAAFRAIAADEGVDDDVREEAAQALAEIG